MFRVVEMEGLSTGMRWSEMQIQATGWTAFAPSMEANMMTIRHPAAEAAEHSARSSLDALERRPHQIGLRRSNAAQRFALYALHGEERRGGKAAKLHDLYARLKLRVL